eukprot:scaffold7149_cov308-Prasinococcus_capsulatus_cf.AAC.1
MRVHEKVCEMCRPSSPFSCQLPHDLNTGLQCGMRMGDLLVTMCGQALRAFDVPLTHAHHRHVGDAALRKSRDVARVLLHGGFDLPELFELDHGLHARDVLGLHLPILPSSNQSGGGLVGSCLSGRRLCPLDGWRVPPAQQLCPGGSPGIATRLRAPQRCSTGPPARAGLRTATAPNR